MITLDHFKALVGDLARPFAIIISSASAAIATVIIACKVDGFDGAALFIGAVYAGVGALYGGKAWENVKTAQAARAPASSASAAGGGSDFAA